MKRIWEKIIHPFKVFGRKTHTLFANIPWRKLAGWLLYPLALLFGALVALKRKIGATRFGKRLDKAWLKVLHWSGEKPETIKVASSLLAVVFGLLFGFIVMLVVDPSSAGSGFLTIILGPFQQGMRSVGDTIFYAVPIILTGLSVAFAFRTGLFNIGASGQLYVGAFVAVYIGVQWDFLGPFHWVVASLGAMLAGAAWGAIPGLLKAFRNVHEVVVSIMLNYVSIYLVNLAVRSFIFNPTLNRALGPESSAHIPTLFLENIFPRSSINIGIFITLAAVFLFHILLNRTVFGYELKSVGLNRDAARYAGMKEKRNITLSMTIAGSIAGLAGAMMYLVPGTYIRILDVPVEQGFTGIAIALLGLSAPVGVLIAGLFYGAINRGGYFAQSLYREEIVNVIIAVIIYFSALSLFTQQMIAKYINRRTKKEIQLKESEGDVG